MILTILLLQLKVMLFVVKWILKKRITGYFSLIRTESLLADVIVQDFVGQQQQFL